MWTIGVNRVWHNEIHLYVVLIWIFMYIKSIYLFIGSIRQEIKTNNRRFFWSPVLNLVLFNLMYSSYNSKFCNGTVNFKITKCELYINTYISLINRLCPFPKWSYLIENKHLHQYWTASVVQIIMYLVKICKASQDPIKAKSLEKALQLQESSFWVDMSLH
jgi:hypothetical protein